MANFVNGLRDIQGPVESKLANTARENGVGKIYTENVDAYGFLKVENRGLALTGDRG